MNLPEEREGTLTAAKSSNRQGAAETAAIRKAAVADVLNAQTETLMKAERRTSLTDVDAVRAATVDYMHICASIGLVPNFEGLAARLGFTRSYLYRFLRENPDSETARFLDQARLMWASARMQLGERGILDAAMSIFILKNSNLNFADKHELEIDTDPDRNSGRPAWAQGMSDEQYMNEIMRSIPDET